MIHLWQFNAAAASPHGAAPPPRALVSLAVQIPDASASLGWRITTWQQSAAHG